ncbi:hypothetical protein ACAZ27_00225 [Akkermansia muciniphila]|jgi:hypothetical protein|nr:hypothetical protein CXU18_00210 [Akkermansia muciniphila]PNC47891.1 hypothetical protein CXU11_10035 [Akkermansia muciniphila]PNC51773.1 hypothetical protein CXU15_04715 [Akkermansia muciniphila]DAJ78831.1 MAG TPA: hypothetical protein [Caudoviricetes sp.]
MEGLKQFIVSIVEQTIQSLHDRGLLLVNEGDEEKAARMFGGKLELSMNDLKQHPACGWSRKKVIKLLQDGCIEDLGTSIRDYRISAVSVYRFLTKEKISQTGVDMNRPPAKRKRNPSSTISN